MDSSRRFEERIFASAMRIEHHAARRLGQSVLVGIACNRHVPTRPVISFGFAGALCDSLSVAAVVVISKVVDVDGRTLWEEKPLEVPGATSVVAVSADHVVNSPKERAELLRSSGARMVDMETGIYAREGVLAGGIRVISDTPAQPLASMSGLYWFGLKAIHTLYTLKF